MTKNEIEHMWKIATNDPNHDTNWYDPRVILFAHLIAAAEREVVAVFLEKECDEQYLADRVRSREFNGAEKWMK